MNDIDRLEIAFYELHQAVSTTLGAVTHIHQLQLGGNPEIGCKLLREKMSKAFGHCQEALNIIQSEQEENKDEPTST